MSIPDEYAQALAGRDEKEFRNAFVRVVHKTANFGSRTTFSRWLKTDPREIIAPGSSVGISVSPRFAVA
jgi:hypothetical protein